MFLLGLVAVMALVYYVWGKQAVKYIIYGAMGVCLVGIGVCGIAYYKNTHPTEKLTWENFKEAPPDSTLIEVGFTDTLFKDFKKSYDGYKGTTGIYVCNESKDTIRALDTYITIKDIFGKEISTSLQTDEDLPPSIKKNGVKDCTEWKVTFDGDTEVYNSPKKKLKLRFVISQINLGNNF